MNGDSMPDLISLYEGDAIAVHLNNGNGTFGSSYSHPVTADYTGTALAVSVEPGVPPEIVVATNPGDGSAFRGNR